MKKEHKEHTPKKDAKLLEDVRIYLRANAPQVKFIIIDNLFTGVITVTERESFKTKPGYKSIELKFNDFDELKKHYAPISSKTSRRNASANSKPRNKPKGNSRSAKGKVEKHKPKKRNGRRNDE